MSIKEKPLIDAVEKLGPLPSWLFAHPFFTGFFAIMMVPIFGAVFTVFWSMLGGPNAVELFDAAIIGAVAATAISAIVLIGILISALFTPDERTPRALFVAGGFFATVLIFAVIVGFYDDVRQWLSDNNPQIWPGSI